MRVSWRTGVQASELIGMRVQDIDFESCSFCGCDLDMHQDHYWDAEDKHGLHLHKVKSRGNNTLRTSSIIKREPLARIAITHRSTLRGTVVKAT